jgi:acetylornithine/succinyldiaminopimelate/putrescine aminotransferase
MTAFQDLEERYSSGVYAKRGVTIVRGAGTRLWDDQGKEVHRLCRRDGCGEPRARPSYDR